MAISRITTWVDGQVLNAAALNAEFDNIINNGTALISPLTANLNFNFNRANNFRLDQVSAYTITTTNNQGRLAFNITDNTLVLSPTSTGPFRPIGPQTNQPTRVSGLVGSMVSNVGSFAASQGYTMKTTMGLMFGVSATSSFSVDTQTAGPVANGRDQAAAFTSTAVHFYAIAIGPGSTAPQGIVSSTPPPTGPTLPTGVFGWCYLGSAIYTPASSVMTRNTLVCGNTAMVSSGVTLSLAGTATSATGVNCGGVVPTNASQMILEMQGIAGTTSGGRDISASFVLYAPTTGFEVLSNRFTDGTGEINHTHTATVWGRVPNLESTPTVYYANEVDVGTVVSLSLYGHGYILPNGDV